MTLYDGFINRILDEIPKTVKKFSFEKSKLKTGSKNSILLMRDTAYELGGSQKPCLSTTVVTSSIHFDNCTYLCGKDLVEIKNDSPFGKIVLLEIEDLSEDEAFDKIKELEQIRYNYCPEGFMTRASAISLREQIRVSKKAVREGVFFKDYGNALISEYMKNPLVKSVRIIFLTEFQNFDSLYLICDKIKSTTSALNHILDNLLFDCSTCNLKSICDEVEGMKELHMKNK